MAGASEITRDRVSSEESPRTLRSGEWPTVAITAQARADLNAALNVLGFTGSPDFVAGCDDDEIVDMQNVVATCATGRATWLVRYRDGSTSDLTCSVAYVDSTSESAAEEVVRRWDCIERANAIELASPRVPGWERAEARRFYLAAQEAS